MILYKEIPIIRDRNFSLNIVNLEQLDLDIQWFYIKKNQLSEIQTLV